MDSEFPTLSRTLELGPAILYNDNLEWKCPLDSPMHWILEAALTPKGKPPTKGAKQILMENSATVNFYRNMALGAGCFHIVVLFALYSDSITPWTIAFNLVVISINTICYQAMKSISRPKLSDNDQLIDPGLDLNMEGGMGEHVKDIVILSSITHVLAVFSVYFWLLLLLIPVRAFWLLWKNVLGPWFFQEAPTDAEQDEKKKKKMERKMKRYQK